MEGRLILDRFVLEEELGRGGYGIVYRARDERLQREVAVKALEHGPASRRVLREAQAAARLNHRSIVTLYELGEDEDGVYLVSELVDGVNLRELIRYGELSDRDVAEAGAELCEALSHAHEHGVVHRDVKPENVAVARWEESRVGPWSRTRPSRAMLMDFGVASLAGSSDVTRTGEVVGTLAYMAPEHAEGERAGPEADGYSLALVIYESWSGANPVVRSTPAATARAIGTRLPPLATRRPDLPHELSATVDACLEAAPAQRPEVLELRDQLNLACPVLDASAPVPDGQAERRLPSIRPRIARLAVVSLICAAIAAIAWGAGQGGLALVLAVLCLPAPILFERARDWVTPAAAPFLGLLGLAPLYPAVAGLAGSIRRCAVLGLLGWCWIVVGEAVLGETLLFGVADPVGTGWESSPSAAASEVLAPLLSLASLAGAAAWTLAAALLGALLSSRGQVVRAVGALAWGAGLVAIHRLLAGDGPDPVAAGLVAALAAVLIAALAGRAERPALPGPTSISPRAAPS
ncbi:MAG: serine/threonine-protein kinase, partial [Solirubrobacterales bacterium]